MNIAVVAWGSLIWDPKTLAIRGRWRVDGPHLPIEFARVSLNRRLTLVIHPPSPPQKTYWVLSAHDAIDEARANLAKREGSPVSRIHFALRDRICDPAAPIEETIHHWLRDRSGVDAAIWTGLSATLRGADVVQEALAHVSALEAVPEDHARAKRYVVKGSTTNPDSGEARAATARLVGRTSPS